MIHLTSNSGYSNIDHEIEIANYFQPGCAYLDKYQIKYITP